MKKFNLIGYIKPPIEENIFLIPIYQRSENKYVHEFDLSTGRISKFVKIDLSIDEIVLLPLNFQKEISINDKTIFGYQISSAKILLGNYSEVSEKLLFYKEKHSLNSIILEELEEFFDNVKMFLEKDKIDTIPSGHEFTREKIKLVSKPISNIKKTTKINYFYPRYSKGALFNYDSESTEYVKNFLYSLRKEIAKYLNIGDITSLELNEIRTQNFEKIVEDVISNFS